MKFREIGRTGIQVSEIGFGCGGNAGLMLNGSPSERRSVIARAIELGVNYFDNAPDYGDGLAEENLGADLKALGQRPLITSKVEVRAANLADIAAHVVWSTEQSLRRLQADCLDFLQIHNGPSRAPVRLEGKVYTQLHSDDFLQPGGAIEGLQRVLREGKARHLGFICRGNDAAEVRELIDTGIFSLINVPYTLLNPSAGGAVPAGLAVERDYGAVIDYALAHGVGCAIYSPLSGGALTDHAIAGGERHPLARAPGALSAQYRRDLQRARALGFLNVPGSHTLAQAAHRFILMHPGVSTVIGGFSDLPQLEECVPAACAGPLEPALMARVQAAWSTNFGLDRAGG